MTFDHELANASLMNVHLFCRDSIGNLSAPSKRVENFQCNFFSRNLGDDGLLIEIIISKYFCEVQSCNLHKNWILIAPEYFLGVRNITIIVDIARVLSHISSYSLLRYVFTIFPRIDLYFRQYFVKPSHVKVVVYRM